MKSLDTDKPARVRQEAQDRISKVMRGERRSLLKLIAAAMYWVPCWALEPGCWLLIAGVMVGRTY